MNCLKVLVNRIKSSLSLGRVDGESSASAGRIHSSISLRRLQSRLILEKVCSVENTGITVIIYNNTAITSNNTAVGYR